ncbi:MULTISPECIES: DUF2442 domain-containing protein [Clostridium]|uniref:DUF2442 domain-containing protein n=1 Tax=Clostridium TaxID=1485 RepID=UPI0008241129|nr:MULTISPECIES: DUF2442 domain-containing protein [Clostridium]PJI08668.1 DUF2442 domain-containing protein [Clostridium sp. CT7]
MNTPKIKSINVNSKEYSINVLFDNGVIKHIDFKGKLKEDFYSDLKNKLLFDQAKIDAGGYGISWNDDIDISEYELWNM